MGELSPWHWLIIVLVFVLLFGAKRLPDAARSLGKSMRILKTEVKGLHDDDAPADAGAPGTPAAALPPAPATPPPPAPVTTDATPNAAATSTAGESTDAR
ncbi:MAG: Sec-independent protein translocase subunit TatA [Frankiaceae bacterium]|nr:Sec-independent protein translocase subunit TatA [Frankiaceae bacterium]